MIINKSSEGERSKIVDQNIRLRFFDAMDKLIMKGEIKNYFNFCNTHNLAYPNFHRLFKSKTRTPSYYLLSILALEYRVSMEWIITGKGASKNS